MATELTTESYIGHHLTNLTCGKTPDGWTCDPYMVDKMGFWAFHVDSLFWSILLGALFITIFRLGIPKSTDSAPSGLQNITEIGRAHVWTVTQWPRMPSSAWKKKSSILLVVFPPKTFSLTIPIIGVILVFIIWVSTAFLQIPQHNALSKAYEFEAHNLLVQSNWIRTIAWSMRGLLLLYMLHLFLTQQETPP